MTNSTAGPTHCANCGLSLTGSFCAQCGQKSGPVNPTTHDLIHEFIHEFLHFDGKIFTSVWLLLFKPGFLSSEQFKGRRTSYVSPIRLYLVFSLLYFAVASAVPDAAFRINISYTPDADDTVEEISQAQSRLPAAREQAVSNVVRWLPRAMFVLVPLLAVVVHVLNRKSGRNYPQHLYFALHVQAAWFFAATIAAAARIGPVGAIQSILPPLALLYAMGYLIVALRHAYSLTTAGALVRAATVAVAYAVLLLAAFLSLIAPVIFAS